ncbi:helix-turn-helix domain-containing protein [Pseudomonas sp. H2_C01]
MGLAANDTAEKPALLQSLSQLDSDFSIDGLESRLINEALQLSSGNLAAAARSLGLSRAQFAYRLKKHQRGVPD